MVEETPKEDVKEEKKENPNFIYSEKLKKFVVSFLDVKLGYDVGEMREVVAELEKLEKEGHTPKE